MIQTSVGMFLVTRHFQSRIEEIQQVLHTVRNGATAAVDG